MTGPRAVLLDLDGTLYHQRPLRGKMFLELGRLFLRAPRRASRVARQIHVFRRTREELRELGRPSESLLELQYTRAAGRLSQDPNLMIATVDEWVHRRPLRHLPAVRRVGLRRFLAQLAERGIAAGVFSDYPADAKLEALGVSESFSLKLCSTDPDINAFKPHPRGFLQACERWGLSPADVLYVGDRPEVDAAGAHSAGMPCVILDPHAAGEDPATVRSFSALSDVLQSRH